MSLGFGVLAPAIPQFALEFGVTNFWASSLISVVALTRVIGAPVGGWMLTRFGEIATFAFGMSVSALSTAACAIAANFPQLLIFRGISGFGSVATTIATMALIIRLSPPASRGRVSSLNAAGFMSGALLGPLFGAVLVPFGLRAPFVFNAIMVTAALAVVWFAMRKSTLKKLGRADENYEPFTVRESLRIPQFRSLLLSAFVFNWATYGVRNSVVPLFAIAAISTDPATAAWVLAAFALGNTLFIIPAGRWSDTIGRKPMLIWGMLLGAVGYIIFPSTTNLWIALALMVLAGVGAALANPGQQAVLADVVGSRSGGSVISFYSIFGDIGMVAGPLIAGAIADLAGFGWAFSVTAALMVLSALAWLGVADSRKLEN